MKQIQVDLGVRSYPIYIGQNLMSDGETLSRYLLKNVFLSSPMKLSRLCILNRYKRRWLRLVR